MSVNNIQGPTKFCKHCGGKISEKAVFCPLCGCQVEEIVSQNNNHNQPIIINNSNTNVNSATAVAAVGGVVVGSPKNKWVALLLCICLGVFGAHKFYEGKILTGILYLCTVGICFIGVIIDIIALLGKPTTYYV